MSGLEGKRPQGSGEAAHCQRNGQAALPPIARCARDFVTALAEDRPYLNAAELWVKHPHVQAQMRLAGVEECFVSGDGSDYEKFCNFCTVMGDIFENPLKEQVHASLRMLFDCSLSVCDAHCDAIWMAVAEALRAEPMGARALVRRYGISTLLCAADPGDALLDFLTARAAGIGVLPLFCPDALLDTASSDFPAAVRALGEAHGVSVTALDSLGAALQRAVARFAEMGCPAAVHSVWPKVFCRPDPYHAELALQRALRGESLTALEQDLLQAQLWRILGKEYRKHGLMLELPSGGAAPMRYSKKFHTVCGGISYQVAAELLDYLRECDGLPRIALYIADPAEATAAAALGARYPAIGQGVPQLALGVVRGASGRTRARLEALAAVMPLGDAVGSFTDFRLCDDLSDAVLFHRVLCDMCAASGGETEAARQNDIPARVAYQNFADYCML